MSTRPALVAALLVMALGFGQSAGDPCDVGAQTRSLERTQRGGPRLSVLHRVLSGIQPKSVALSPDGNQVWVANFGRPDRDNVKVYDADSLELLGTVEFPGNAVEFAFSPDGATAYVSNFRRHTIHEVDARTFEVRRELEVGGHPKVMVVSPDGARIYVANWAGSQVTEVDAEAFTVTRRLPTGEHPRGMVLADEGQQLYVAAMYSHLVHVFARDADEQTTEFRPCRYPRAMQLSPDETRLYASCSCCRQVRWFDRAGHLRGMATTGENPRSIDLSDDGRWLAVADFDDTTVTLIDTVENTHRIVPVPDANQIVGVAVRARGESIRVYATSWLTGELVVLGTPEPGPEPSRPEPSQPEPSQPEPSQPATAPAH
ncbi:MAG: YncE family protein [Sandaracinaceae bacterium]